MNEITNNIIIDPESKTYSWEKDGKKIITPSKKYLTDEERLILQYCFKTPLPDDLREDYWLLITGAKKLKLENPTYYNTLLYNYPKNPLSDKNENQIYLDIYRTFPEDENFRKEKIDSLKNVLTAYSRRNCSLGYCQGFNYIVGKLLKVVKDEENVFWIFTQIIENILPINYYYDSAGIIIDNYILFERLERLNKTLMNHFTKNKFELLIKNILYKWLICLFSQNIKDELLFLIWDIFFIEGTQTLFKTIIIIFEKNEEELLKITSVDKLIHLFDSVHSLSLLNQHKDELLKDLMKYNNQINAKTVKEGRRKNYRKVKESMAKFKKKQYKILNNVKCDINWDNCVDIKRRNDGDDFIVYQKKEEPEIIDDYYNKKYKRYNSVKINKNKNDFSKLINNYFKYDNLMVQRRQHECFEAKIQRIKSCININNDISRNILEGNYMFKDDKKNENKLVDDLNNNEKNYENNINDDKNFQEEYNDMLMNNLYYDL
mgnify:CR=1 FL=1